MKNVSVVLEHVDLLNACSSFHEGGERCPLQQAIARPELLTRHRRDVQLLERRRHLLVFSSRTRLGHVLAARLALGPCEQRGGVSLGGDDGGKNGRLTERELGGLGLERGQLGGVKVGHCGDRRGQQERRAGRAGGMAHLGWIDGGRKTGCSADRLPPAGQGQGRGAPDFGPNSNSAQPTPSAPHPRLHQLTSSTPTHQPRLRLPSPCPPSAPSSLPPSGNSASPAARLVRPRPDSGTYTPV